MYGFFRVHGLLRNSSSSRRRHQRFLRRALFLFPPEDGWERMRPVGVYFLLRLRFYFGSFGMLGFLWSLGKRRKPPDSGDSSLDGGGSSGFFQPASSLPEKSGLVFFLGGRVASQYVVRFSRKIRSVRSLVASASVLLCSFAFGSGGS